MEIEILNVLESGYIHRAERIVDLYNDASSSPFLEELNLARPESTKIITVEGDTGGLLLDHHPSERVYRVMFAAFDLENRRKGYLRSCLHYAKSNGIDIALAEVDDGNAVNVWGALGFVHLGSMGLGIVACDRKLESVNFNAIVHFQ